MSKLARFILAIYYNHAQVQAVFTDESTGSGFDLAWFGSLSSKHLCVFGLRGVIYI